MDHERWNRIGEILADALELPPPERSDFLTERCGGDEDLRAEVEDLLLASEEDGLLPADPEPEAPDLVGTTIAHYRVEALIGVGGMGRVYRGVDTVLGREVALKVVAGDDEGDLHLSARFRREARILASLNHPNVGAIYGFERWEGRLVLVLEYVEGPTLAERLEEGPLDVREAVGIATQVAAALEAAHERGIVHRDLKPGNIVLATGGVAKVLDFGIAKPLGEPPGLEGEDGSAEESSARTAAGRVLGTPAYMSPEQIRGRPVDTRADLWAFGVILFEMLAGAGPFDGEDEALRMARILDQPPDWSALPGHVPSSLRTLIGRCLIKYPGLRLQSIGDSLPFLETAGRQGTSGLWERLGRWMRERRAAAAAVALALVVIAAGIVLGRRPFAAPLDESPRVLVLPFEFLGEPGDEYLAEGVSEEIRDRLAALASVTVLGRQTAVYVARRGMGPEEIGAELDADFILDGTVRLQRRGGGPDRMRVRAALTSARTLSELWSETYDGFADDVFTVQAEVAGRVADAVGVEVPEGRGPAGEGTPDLQAYDYYLRGNEYSRRSELETPMRAALAMYEEATRLDPDFAAAWGALSIMRSRLRWRGYDGSDENLQLARSAAERALALDPGEARGHLALGYVHYYGSRAYDPALASFTAAAALQPSDPETHFAVGVVARRKGDWELAVDALMRALNADPRHAEVAIILGETYLALGRYRDAAARFDRAVAIAPDRPGGYLFQSWLRLASGEETGPALDAIEAGWERAGEDRVFGLVGRYLSQIDWWMTRVLAGEPRFRRLFGAADLLALGVDSADHYLHRAEFHRGAGESERARVYADSARIVLEARVALHRELDGDEPTVLERSRQAARLAHLGLAYAGLGRKADALAAATEGVDHIPAGHDAVHGSEARIQLGLILGIFGERERAIRHLAAALAEPSAFRVEMLRHDPELSSLLEDPRLRTLAARR